MSLRRMMLFTLGAKIKNLVSAFKKKVLAELAFFESESCLEAQLNTTNNQNLLNSASLIVTPNAYNAGKLYSVVPSDGTGDFTVTRATSATRVNSQGLVEIPVTNLINFSEEIDNSAWIKTGPSNIIVNFAISPSGLMNADRYIQSSPSNLYRNIITTSGTNYTFSVYVKSTNIGVGQNIRIGNFSIGFIEILTTNNWVRYQYSFVATGTSSLVGFTQSLITSNTDILIWGSQLEQNVSATEYIPTTAVVRTKFAGITQDGNSASNIPRLDYTNASCPSILVEPQRTNLLPYSDQFSLWTSSANVTNNTDIAPDNMLSADTISDLTIFFHPKLQNITVPTNSTVTFSVFIKKTIGSISYYPGVALVFQANSIRSVRLILNSTTGTFNLEGVTATAVSAKVVSFNNYWKVELTATDNGSNDQVQVLVYPSISLDGVTISALAQGSNVFWGAQLELGGNATSYIPTTTTAVTRNTDVINKSSATNLIGQTEGTIYIKFYKTLQTEGLKTLLILSGVSINSDSIQIITPNNNTNISANIVVNGIITGLSGGSRVLLDGLNKICLVYSPTGSKFFFNGVLTGTVSNVRLPPMFNINLGSSDAFRAWGAVNDVVLWKTQLTDAEAIQLTTL